MMDFKYCNPDANRFRDVIKIKKLDNWSVEYFKLTEDIGYWIAEHPFETDEQFELFKNVIASFPVQKDNSHPDNFDPNPFDTIHLPDWVYQDICFLIRDFYFKHVTDKVQEPQIHEWGNLYFKNRTRPISCWRYPHIDYVYGMVANMWFTDHDIKDSCTKLYKYHGKMHNDVYDFQLDLNHPMRKEWEAISVKPFRMDSWINIPDDELARWGFELVGSVPTKEKTLSMYKANVCHTAVVGDAVDFRWSHAFAYSHEQPVDTFFRDIFK
jgi:hypothetical protein